MLRLPIFAIICIWVFTLGILSLHFSDKNDSCSMTYMFEYPQFVRITVDDAEHLPQYGLYAYSEGRFTERARKMWFDGVPVLFLPGNSGSHMQARSLASVALRKAISSGTNFHFDFFTISFNEEISALYGGVLQKQTEFTHAAINKILQLYQDNEYTKSVPTSVILIGHSMGGVIAKRLLGQDETMNKTNIAIALSAPLLAPVMNFDVEINKYYLTMNDEWENNVRTKEDVKSNKLLLSFSGGYRDVLIPSGLTIDNDSYVSASTTSLPGAWVSSDHVGIVWCKQVVMAINKFLFAIVNPYTQQVADNMKYIRSKAEMYFKSNRSMTLSPRSHAIVPMTADAFWYEDNRRIYQISRPEIDKMTYLMIRLVGFPQNRFVAVEGVNVSDSDWIFGCNAKEVMNSYRYCSRATSLSELSRWTGAAQKSGKRKLATIHLHDLAKKFPDWTHVVVKVSPTRKPVILNVDINDLDSRQVNFGIGATFFGKTVVIPETEQGSLYYEVILPQFTNVQQAFYLHIEPSAQCRASQYHVSAELYVPWAPNHGYFHYFTNKNTAPMKIRLITSIPLKDYSDKLVAVHILLDPQCTFSISLSISWYQRVAQLVRHYIPVLVPYMSGVLLLVLARSFEKFAAYGVWIPTRTALLSLVTSMIEPQLCYGAIVGVTILFAQLEKWTSWFVSAGWNNLELQLFFVLSCGVFPTMLAALTFVYTIASAIQVLLMFSSQVTHRFFFRIVWWGAGSFAEQLAEGLQKVPLVVSIGLLFGAPLSCGAASLVVGAAFYAFMLSKMYEEYLEDYVQAVVLKFLRRILNKISGTFTARRQEAVRQIRNNLDRARRSENNVKQDENDDVFDSDEQLVNLNFHFTMFLLWLNVAILNLPALITWARNFNEEKILKVDTSFIPGVVMAICSACLWQMGAPRKNLNYGFVIKSTYFIALIVLSLGPTSLFLASYGMTVAVFIVTAQQFVDRTDNGHFCGWFAKSQPDDEKRKIQANIKGKVSVQERDNRREVDEKNKPGRKEGDKPGQRLGDKPGERAQDKPGERAQDKPGERAQDKPGEKAGDKPGERAGDKPGEMSGDKPGEMSGDKPGEKAGDKPGDNAGEKAGDKPGGNTGERARGKAGERSMGRARVIAGQRASDLAAGSSATHDEPGLTFETEPADENDLLVKIKQLKEKFAFLHDDTYS